MNEIATQEPEAAFRISARAAERIAELREAEGKAGGGTDFMLRVTVSGGGCAGFQYAFDFDDKTGEEDRLFERDGVRVVIDEISLDFLRQGELDYVEDLIGSYFSIKNPNATSTCGCGTSFSFG